MYKKLSIYYLVILCSFFLFCSNTVQATNTPVGTGAYTITDIKTALQGDTLLMTLKGDSAPAYTMYELYSPPRLVLDIAEADLAETIDAANILPENNFVTLKVTPLKDKNPQISRFEFTLAESHKYKVNRMGNDLSIILSPQQNTSPTDSTQAAQAPAGDAPAALHDIVVRTKGNKTEILFKADKPVNDYRQSTATGRDGLQDSMFIDINNIDGAELVREKAIGTNLDKIRVATRGTGVRIVFDSGQKGLFSYDIKTNPQGLLVIIDESSVAEAQENPGAANSAGSKKAVTSDPTLDALIGSSEAVISEKTLAPGENVTAAEAMEDSFGFSGYKATRISVDFYKIDLHNVFRLFRQISNVNLIVDESVSGSLTLALNDVPWDFALDIILNLKNLKKEERHNTIVIYSSKNNFAWPENASDNLSFEADVEVIQQEALIIQQSANQSAEIMQAKEFLRRAKIEEKNDDMEDAAMLYEKAFALWPTNIKISNKLAALYLVNLGMNAKCVHYAKETLKVDKKNYQAALYAAIASANMDQVPEAMEYFSQSINGTPPMKEALISYAAFSEEKGQPEAALKLLKRYAEVYSDDINTMTSRARLYDAMGQTKQATEQYKKLLYSGYQLVPGLKNYIRSRLTMNQDQITQ
jgi:type IV pilus assembly protein PilQ